jgi:hypothetical protein
MKILLYLFVWKLGNVAINQHLISDNRYYRRIYWCKKNAKYHVYTCIIVFFSLNWIFFYTLYSFQFFSSSTLDKFFFSWQVFFDKFLQFSLVNFFLINFFSLVKFLFANFISLFVKFFLSILFLLLKMGNISKLT